MAAFEPDQAAVSHRKGQMVFDFSGKEGVAACFRRGGPFIAAPAAAQPNFADYGVFGTHDPDGVKIELMQISEESPQMKFIRSL